MIGWLLMFTSLALAQTPAIKCLKKEKTAVIQSCSDQKYRVIAGLKARNNFIEDVVFFESTFQDSVFENVIFRRIDFRGAKFKKVKFINCQFEDSNFSGSRWHNSSLKNPQFVNVKNAGSYFNGVNVEVTKAFGKDGPFSSCYSVDSETSIADQKTSLCNEGLHR